MGSSDPHLPIQNLRTLAPLPTLPLPYPLVLPLSVLA
jgi:hypothetical protein